MQPDVIIVGAGAAGLMCAIEAGKRGRSGARARAQCQHRRENPDLRRRPLQLHQHSYSAGKLHLRESIVCKVRARPLQTGRLSCSSSSDIASAGTKRRWASCSATGPRRKFWHAAEGMRRRGREDSPGMPRRPRFVRVSASRPTSASSNAPRWSSPPADSRFRNSAQPISDTAIAKQFGLRVTTLRPGLVPLLFDEPKESSRTSRRFVRSRGALRPHSLSGERSFHASRAERARNSADLVVLEAWRHGHDRGRGPEASTARAGLEGGRRGR